MLQIPIDNHHEYVGAIAFTKEEVELLLMLGYTSQSDREKFLARKPPITRHTELARLLGVLYSKALLLDQPLDPPF